MLTESTMCQGPCFCQHNTFPDPKQMRFQMLSIVVQINDNLKLNFITIQDDPSFLVLNQLLVAVKLRKPDSITVYLL